MNLTQLKKQKTVKAVRVDTKFVDNATKIANFEKDCLDSGYEIIKKQQNGILVCYELLNRNLMSFFDFMLSKEDTQEIIDDYIEHIKKIHNNLTFVKYENLIDKLRVTFKETSLRRELILSNECMQKTLDGAITFTSKGYYFEFMTDGLNKKRIYGDSIYAKNIQDNKIVLDNGIEYILN